MEYVIFARGAEAGTLTLETEGLWYRLSARCRDLGPGVWRLWGCFGPESRPMGVFRPETGGLCLERRFSRHSLPILPDCFAAGREIEGFRPWRGILEGREIPDAMVRAGETGPRLALFPPAEGPVPLAPWLSVMEAGELEGRPCLFLDLADGLPELPEPEDSEPQVEAELHGAVVGAEDLLVDVGEEEPVPEPV